MKHEIPLLKDHHDHPSVYAVLASGIDLRDIDSKEEALRLIHDSNEEVNIVQGWFSSKYHFSDLELDSLPPTVICNASLHGFLMNQPAREKFYDAYPEIVTHIDDSQWTEKNLYTILGFLSEIKRCDKRAVRSHYDNYLLPKGVWYAEDLLLPSGNIITSFKDSGCLERTKIWMNINTFNGLDASAQEYVYGIKVFLDGALGPKTAAVNETYSDGNKGLLLYSDEECFGLLSQLREKDKPLAIHAIGDLATDQVVRVLSQVEDKYGSIPPSRIEHCQFVSQENAEKAKSLGLILSMQPAFSLDTIEYTDRLSEAYLRRGNPFRMLIDQAGFVPGKDLLLGSDGMPHGVQCALEQSLFPPLVEQALTLEEFVAGYCMPDRDNGYIEVDVDTRQKRIEVEVITS